jgi:hypothetical protein
MVIVLSSHGPVAISVRRCRTRTDDLNERIESWLTSQVADPLLW